MISLSIAIIIDTLNGGGAEKVCLTLSKALTKRGYNTHLIVLKKKCEYDLPDGINIHFLYENPKIKLYRSHTQLDAAKKLRSLTAKLGGFDVHFSNLDECHPIVAKANLPNSYYVLHNSVENILKRTSKLGPLKYWRKWKSFNVLNNKNLIAVSEGVKGEIEKNKSIRAQSITTIYNPLDLDEIATLSREQDKDIPEKPYIIYVGRIAEQKRVDILIRAYEYIKSDVSLVLLGSDSKKLERIKHKNKVTKEIIVQPFKQNPYPWIANAKALVLSSDYEGFGMVLVEALACKTNIASTDCPHGPHEILTGELSQCLAPPKSPKELAEKIDLAIKLPESSDRPRILEEVCLNKVVEKYVTKANHKVNERKSIAITFYLPNYEKLDSINTLDPFSAWQEMPRGEGFWILQTYCLLRHYGVDVNISRDLPNSGVLVFHRRNKNTLFEQPNNKIKNLILVGCRGDLHDTLIPDFELLQNDYFSDGEHKFSMPHWPMPNIVPRDPARGNTIKRIAFKGFAAQLHPDFHSKEWLDFLKSLDIEWVENAVTFTHNGKSTFNETEWADYHDIDLVIAVRPERNDFHTNKPALKLYNAWLAGVPAILGRECAYREVGSDGIDYVEINSLSDAKKTIQYLVANPEAYEKMIHMGNLKAPNYTHEAVCEAWKHFFYEILPEKIEKRQNQLTYKIFRHIPLRIRYRLLQSWKKLSFQRMR